MAEAKKTYAVTLTFSEETAEKINGLRTEYQELTDYVIDPHITLVYPFMPVFSLFRVNEQLDKVARRTKQFSITLNGIEFFENGNNVVYAALENRRPVKKLHTDIIKSLEGLIKEWRTDGKFNLEKFVPHVTIGEHIPDNIFPEIKKQYSKYWIHYEEKITRFILFSEKDGIWERKRVFKLVG
jgi:2'-5' RNA ligase